MCLAPVVASTLGTHAIPFSNILPSTCCLYPKDKHRWGATLPAAAILGTPSGFPLACTPRVCLPGHSWKQLGQYFYRAMPGWSEGQKAKLHGQGEAVYNLPCQGRQRELQGRRNWLPQPCSPRLHWPHAGYKSTLWTIVRLSALIWRVWITSFISLQRPAEHNCCQEQCLDPQAFFWAFLGLQNMWVALLIPELSSLAEDLSIGHIHALWTDITTNRGAWARTFIQEQEHEGMAPCRGSLVLHFSLDFVANSSTTCQSQLRKLGTRGQVCESGHTACDSFQPLCPMHIFLLFTASPRALKIRTNFLSLSKSLLCSGKRPEEGHKNTMGKEKAPICSFELLVGNHLLGNSLGNQLPPSLQKKK